MLEPGERGHPHLRITLSSPASPQDESVEPAGPVGEQSAESGDDDGQQFPVGSRGPPSAR